MKIYPDPELPDIEVEWYDGDCAGLDGSVLLTLTGVDDTAVKQELSVACNGLGATFKDVPRQRYMLDGRLVDAMGEEYSRAQPMDLDLRNGIDETAYMYFGGFNNFTVGWQFEGGATCASLGVAFVSVDLVQEGMVVGGSAGQCQQMILFGSGPVGTFDVDVSGFSDNGTVLATSPRIEQVTLGLDAITNLGLVTLAPCGDQCP